MRPVNWTIRDVKQARLLLNQQLPLRHRPRPRSPALHSSRHAVAASSRAHAYQLRQYATGIDRPVGLITSDHLPRSLQPVRPLGLIRDSKPDKVYVQDAATFGKWQWLLSNPTRLAIESDFRRRGPARKWKKTLLVDHLDNYGDFELWNCLLQHLQRMDGDEGVQKVWYAFWGRKSLYQLLHLPDRIFWTTFVEAALRLGDEKFLDSIYLYAEFLMATHNVVWPDLYTTIVPYFLRTRQHEKAVKWHLQLVPNFYPGSQAFVSMMQDFSTDHTLASSFTLQSLYIASPERRLYDAIVPQLYDRGQSRLARLWRKICIMRDDVPRLYAPSRQFLRYLAGYWAKEDLHPREAAALTDNNQSSTNEEDQQIEVTREFMNQVHGKTFGFTAKTYNDSLGSRWFASSWVGLDLAISVVSALGIQEIGPLSLQAICLREETPANILARIAQLQSSGIAIPTSGYAKTIQHLAKTGEDVLLLRLLRCDIHPEVFDDLDMQARLMASSSASGDLSTYTLLLASRLASVDDAAQKTANVMLRLHLVKHHFHAILHLLDDVRGTGVPLDVDTCKLIFAWVQRHVDWHKHISQHDELKFAVAVCRRLNSMDIPVPVSCWARIAYALGRWGYLDDLRDLTLELIDHYTIRQSSRPGFIPVNIVDVPESLTQPLGAVHNLMGLYIPLDTPLGLPLHPLSQIFPQKWQTSLLRWSFREIPLRSNAASPFGAQKRPGTSVENAIHILRRLQDRGARVKKDGLRKALCLRLAELYGNHPVARKIQQQSKQSNVYSLREMKSMIDEAWGGELLPSLMELKAQIRKFDEGYLKEYYEGWVADKHGWETNHPSGVWRQVQRERQRAFPIL
ncbi:hypothetical protein BKA67DRAFT_559997 [Truncatella angustata]|uniref:Pentatricopeptide repeat domain-containing protein n=1 Tax=Truncatella angustata TaxID=152316 RepID=A0A9P8UN38_9PEZI|nr:uncharacterized protein BKA67DRAFT_559997 [Truncatella angustata]KAH6655248.1 hypothetical protein BKA67DRAFT_559997 [Truncatella angustata]KAH8198958.1 hypothetical protein TruAng_006877 [Truncatella angustata]